METKTLKQLRVEEREARLLKAISKAKAIESGQSTRVMKMGEFLSISDLTIMVEEVERLEERFREMIDIW